MSPKIRLDRQALMNFVIVGGGPTGVELAGALAELKRFVFREEYHDLKMEDMQVYLIEGGVQIIGKYVRKKLHAKPWKF